MLDGNQYKIIVECAPNMLWRANTEALCDYFNVTWLNFTGCTMEQEIGHGWAAGVHQDDYENCLRIYLTAFEMRQPFEMVYRLRRHDGEFRWIHDKGAPFTDETGKFGGYIGSCIDVTEQVIGESWRVKAQTDGLTGILNRYFFEQKARELFEEAVSLEQKLCVVMLDIDDFKKCNDDYGHAAGDRILTYFAGILKDNIRDTDMLGRYGGDEFMLLLPEAGQNETAVVINRIKEKAKKPFEISESDRIIISFSYGIAELKKDESFEAVFKRADLAMYEDKKRKATKRKI